MALPCHETNMYVHHEHEYLIYNVARRNKQVLCQSALAVHLLCVSEVMVNAIHVRPKPWSDI